MKTLLKATSLLGWGILIFLCLLISSKTLAYMDFEIKNILIGREVLIKKWTYFFAFYSHVALGTIALLIGPFQFMKGLRKRFVKTHRVLGKLYITSSLLAGIAGLYLAFYANGGWVAKTGFLAAALLLVISGIKGYIHAKRREFNLHRNWLLRSFALIFAAVTLRIWLGVLFGAFHIEYDTTYQIVAWLSWVPNLLVSEAIILRTKNRLTSSF